MREAMPTKIGLHVFHISLYLHEFFEPDLFFDPHGLCPSMVRKGNLVNFEKEQNLRNWRGHTHQNWLACISGQPLLA